MKSIARDLLRIAVFVPFYSENLEQVIDRAWWWADDVYVRAYPSVEYEAVVYEDQSADDLNLTDIQNAWQDFEERLRLQEGDYVAVLFPDEVIVNPQAVRPALRNNMGRSLGLRAVYMYDESQYFLAWSSELIWPFFPYRPDGRFRDFDFVVRGPSYASRIDRITVPAATCLSYQLSTEDQRRYWAGYWGDHRLLQPPSLGKWTGGGTL